MNKKQRVEFINGRGQMLSAVIQFPEVTITKAFAIFSHCFTCNKNLNAVRFVSQALSKQGIAVLSFDFAGLGASEGDFMDTNFSTNVQDIVAASQFLEAQYEAPQLLVGHSLGGAAVLFAANEIPTIKAVATIGAPAQPNHVLHLLGQAAEEVKKGSADVTIGGRKFTFNKQFVVDLGSHYLTQLMKDFTASLLILHSPIDNTVGIENAGQIYDEAHHPKSFMTLDDADHLLSKKEDARYAGQVIGAWANRYLKLEELPELGKYDGIARVLNQADDGYTTYAKSRSHDFIIDEPLDIDGDDLGPTPTEIMGASLASCSAITMRMYANRKNWPLEDVQVDVDFEKNVVAKEDGGKEVTFIFNKHITLKGDLTDEQIKRIKQIASKCPVHKVLEAGAEINSTS